MAKLMIGQHVSRLPPLGGDQGIVQMCAGNMKSLTVPTSLTIPPFFTPDYEIVWHAAYVACMAPQTNKDAHYQYLAGLIKCAKIQGVKKIVVHTGATVGRDQGHVLAAIVGMLESGLRDLLAENDVTICVEVAANISVFNCNPQHLGDLCSQERHLGWCVDLAHVYSSGVKWERLCKIMEEFPPTLCHANFPGTEFASSRDVHGWRQFPDLYQDGRALKIRGWKDIETLVIEWESVVIWLKQRGIPLIAEGSKFPDGDMRLELEILRGLK